MFMISKYPVVFGSFLTILSRNLSFFFVFKMEESFGGNVTIEKEILILIVSKEEVGKVMTHIDWL